MKTRLKLALVLAVGAVSCYVVGSLMAGAGPSCSGHIPSLNKLVRSHTNDLLIVTSVTDIVSTAISDHGVECEGSFHFESIPQTSRWTYRVIMTDDHKSEIVTVKIR
jgi:hypothetical protein